MNIILHYSILYQDLILDVALRMTFVLKFFLKNVTTCMGQLQSNLDGSNTDGSFTMANSNVFESLRNSSDSSRKQIFKEIFLFYREIVCCVYSLESPRSVCTH